MSPHIGPVRPPIIILPPPDRPRSLLPPNATLLELAIEDTFFYALELAVPTADVWDPYACPLELLPWLAWAWGVDNWDDNWSEQLKRNSVAEAGEVRAHEGTLWAIRRVLANAGFPDAFISTGGASHTYNGVDHYDGKIKHGDPTQWATFRIVISRPTTAEIAARLKAAIMHAGSARDKLIEIRFSESKIYDGSITYVGNYTHGGI